MKFYDRKDEMETLKRALKLSDSRLVVVVITGRRRVGKTRLVREFFRREGIGFLDLFVGVKGEKLLMEDFAREVERLMGYSPKFDNFGEFLRYLERLDVRAVFFDEFQNVLRVNPSMAFELQRFIDRNESKPLLLVISGSYIGMMKRLFASRKAPLYGRSTVFMELKPLRPRHVFEMLNDLGIRDSGEKMAFYAVFGGVPKYYELVELLEKKTLRELLVEAVRYSTFLVSEGEGLLIDEFGRAYKTYYSILRAIASGKNRLVEIANLLGMKPGSLSKYLDSLIDYYGIVAREVPVLGGRRSRYVIRDNFLNFWFSMIEPQLRNIEAGDVDSFRRFLGENLNTFLGRAFERVVADVLWDLNGKIFTFDELGPQWGRGYEIDLVAVNKKEEAIFIETKWGTSVDGPREIGKLIAKANLVPWRGEKRFLIIARGFRRKCDDCITVEELLSHLNP
ncbi:ATP-binding protein [Thermococcus sp.]|uniref:ATP-binding protein n=1 Tax=Thermococcus sp. TaxID=35749 RepID=UPI00261329EA|nr:ATP-binding protein [Thermococcus sp.]